MPLSRSMGRLDLAHHGKLSSVASWHVPALARASWPARALCSEIREPGKLLAAVGMEKHLQAGQSSPYGHTLHHVRIALNFFFFGARVVFRQIGERH